MKAVVFAYFGGLTLHLELKICILRYLSLMSRRVSIYGEHYCGKISWSSFQGKHFSSNRRFKRGGQYPYLRYIYIKSLSRGYKTLQRARIVSPSDKFIKGHELKSKSLCQKQCVRNNVCRSLIKREESFKVVDELAKQKQQLFLLNYNYRSRLKSFVKYLN